MRWPQTVDGLRALAAEYREKADRASYKSQHASDYCPGSYVTGSSGRTARQNRATDRGLERTIAWASKAVHYRDLAAQCEMRVQAIEKAPQRAPEKLVAQQQAKVDRQARRNLPPAERLFCGCYPTGWIWSDKSRERNGDYVRLGYQSYRTLELQLEPDCSDAMRELVEASAARNAALRGQSYQIAGNMSITLGA